MKVLRFASHPQICYHKPNNHQRRGAWHRRNKTLQTATNSAPSALSAWASAPHSSAYPIESSFTEKTNNRAYSHCLKTESPVRMRMRDLFLSLRQLLPKLGFSNVLQNGRQRNVGLQILHGNRDQIFQRLRYETARVLVQTARGFHCRFCLVP